MLDSGCNDALSEIMQIRSDYVENRSVFIEGARMTRIVTALGASESDLGKIRLVSNGLMGDPTLPFRKTRNGRFCIDYDDRRVRRLEFQPYTLSKDEDFVRHDSGVARSFDEIGDELQLNATLQALLVVKALIIEGVEVSQRPNLDYSSANWLCTVFNIRTVTDQRLSGEPALEGVHSDGVDHTMTTFVGSQNMTDTSAVTFLHDVRERNARRWYETDPALRLGRHQHRHFLDTLIFVDHERKHSVTPVAAVDPGQTATRDMLLFFTRKPAAPGHGSYRYDSFAAHPTLPLSVDLPDPR